MHRFRVHSRETAPEASQSGLEGVARSLGWIPNLLRVSAESPALLNAYLMLSEIFEKQSGFDATQRQVILLSVSFLNKCRYCMAAHSVMAKHQGVSPEVIDALRDGRALRDPKLEALRVFTRKLVEKRGRIAPGDIAELLARGYAKRHILEVIVGVGLKTLSTYTNHIAQTPLDTSFRAAAWENRHSDAGERCEVCDTEIGNILHLSRA